MSHPDYKNIGTPEDRVIEECGELLQAISKARRFGYFNFHPDIPGRSNMDNLRSEMNDLIEAMERLEIQNREMIAAYFSEEQE